MKIQTFCARCLLGASRSRGRATDIRQHLRRADADSWRPRCGRLGDSGATGRVDSALRQKEELARIIEAFGKGDAGRKDRALDALRRAKQIKLMLTPEVATKGRE